MSIIIILLSVLNLSSSAPLSSPSRNSTHTPLSFFERELPDCPDASRYRNKQDIVISCFATILACTWVAIHPNLPGPWDSLWAKTKTKIVITIYAILAPELVTFWAMRQWMAAGRIADEFNMKYGESDATSPEEVPWYMIIASTLKGLLATIRSGTEECFIGPEKTLPIGWTRTHGFFVQMGGFMLFEGRKPIKALKFGELMEMIEADEVDVPDITENEISDKSKGDFFTKFVAVLQAMLFVAQCFARWATHLPLTELEVATLAFAALNVVTYALWWRKPQNVGVAIRIQRKCGIAVDDSSVLEPMEEDNMTQESRSDDGDSKEGRMTPEPGEAMNKSEWDRRDPCSKRRWRDGWLIGVPWTLFFILVHPLGKMSGMGDFEGGSLRVPMVWADHEEQERDVYPLSVIGVLFGAIHLIPWSSSFPSTAELWMWRLSALIITLEPLMLLLAVLANQLTHHYHDWLCDSLLPVVMGVPSNLIVPFYIPARLALIVLAFTTLRSPPEGIEIAFDWTTLAPYI